MPQEFEALVGEEHLDAQKSEDKIYLKVKGSYQAQEAFDSREDKRKCFAVVTENLQASPCEHPTDRNRDKLALMSDCLWFKQEWQGPGHEKTCEILEHTIKSLGLAEDAEEALQDLTQTLDVAHGRVALLFGDQAMLPEVILRKMAARLYDTGSKYYVYSSFDKTFGAPIGEVVRIRNLQTGKYLTAREFGPQYDHCMQKDLDAQRDNLFTILPSGEHGKYFIRSVKNKHRFLHSKQYPNTEDKWLTLHHMDFSEHEKFSFAPGESAGKKFVHIIATSSNQLLDLKKGGSIHISSRTGDDTQKWVLERAPDNPEPEVAENPFEKYVGRILRIRNLGTGKYLALKAGGTKPGTRMVQYNLDGTEDQLFTLLESENKGTYFIRSMKGPQKIVSVQGNKKGKMQPLVLSQLGPQNTATFSFIPEGEESQPYFRIRSTATQQVLDVRNPKGHGSQVQTWPSHNNRTANSQKWILEEVE